MAIRHTRQWERAVAEFLASPVDDVARKHGRAVVADVLAAAVAGSAAPGSPASRETVRSSTARRQYSGLIDESRHRRPP